MASGWLAAAFLGALLPRLAAADNITNPTSFFYTRPDLQSPIFTVELSEPALVTPGYLFLGVYQTDRDGPLIYDQAGNLVWDGFGASGPGVAHNLQVCNYREQPHLCFFQGMQMLGYGKGHGVIMDQQYRIVKTVEPAGSAMTADLHEFRLQPDGRTALLTIYQPRPADLSAWNVTDGMGWVLEGIFQEVDVDTGDLRFEWRSLDHVPLNETHVPPSTTEISGDGVTKDTPWDYFHINSIDKHRDSGDYLISARHTSTIYKISARDGSIRWRLGGNQSDFALDGFSFSNQHDARWLSENSTHTLLSLYDNASNGFFDSWRVSRGMIVALDHARGSAHLVQTFGHPFENNYGLRARSQGNTQLLPNGHALLSWGPNCYVTEHLPDGRPIFSAWLARTGMMIYRIHKFDWVGTPHWAPNLWTYSRDQHDTVAYASWNGATEVTHWRFWGSKQRDGPFVALATVPKTGFETRFQHAAYYPHVYAEALHDASPLSKSRVEDTFSPGPAVRPHCDAFACPLATPLDLPLETEEERIDREIAELARWDAEEAARAEAAKAAWWAAFRLRVLAALALLFLAIGLALTQRPVRARVRAAGSSTAATIRRGTDVLVVQARLLAGRASKSVAYAPLPMAEREIDRDP